MVRPIEWTKERTNELSIKLRQFFDKPPYTDEIITKTSHKGNPYQETVRKPTDLPTIENFCAENGISTSKFYELTKENAMLMEALSFARNKQKHFLITNGLNKSYDSRFASLVAINLTDMRNTVHTENSNETKLLDVVGRSLQALIASRTKVITAAVVDVKPEG